ncbi:unnamed protein product [Fraxinus pennsylvanica]|uniref:Peripheral subunit-binding (PSBD) domain-containing protein n=1 Tax=Fraxinus pennsylvanica TaxID=56036 RepID=A0AAD2ACQ1_9LAMI|nr:unnamed protein product [Fraxinus pennsylvanica]
MMLYKLSQVTFLRSKPLLEVSTPSTQVPIPKPSINIIAITVEEEEDVTKIKDYQPSTSDSALESKTSPTPSPPKEETEAPPSAGSLIFTGPLAKKLAEDHNISLSTIKGTSPDRRIVRADIEDSRGKEPLQAPNAAATDAAGLDYTDIPHSQIRKVECIARSFRREEDIH